MKTRKIPLRMCVVSREKLEKKALLRIVRTPEGNIVIDKSGRLNGKGAYLKKDVEVINKAKKNKIVERVLLCSVPENVYEELIEIIEKEGDMHDECK